MKYKSLLKKSIAESEMSLTDICKKLEVHGFRTDKTYLSKLQNGKIPPAGDKLNGAISKVLQIDYMDLKVAAYREKIPEDVLEHLKNDALQKEVV